jgi:hypothetical protein
MLNNLLWIPALLGFSLATGAQAQAPEVLNPPTNSTAKKKAKKPKAQSGASAKFIPGSQETKKERSSRLARECKDQVNAGACAGYTR